MIMGGGSSQIREGRREMRIYASGDLPDPAVEVPPASDISQLIDSAVPEAGRTLGGTDRLGLMGMEEELNGRYRLLDRIGEGGFGTVYRARQIKPVQRDVALKLIKLGMDTRGVIARFEAERQVLALMDHPGVAKVFDAGSTPQGRPFFAMELVAGEPIARFCENLQLSVPQRLELFIQVCQAVAHAHTKGIIHRDLKPSNVLVSLQDGAPLPKVIDFGIAKATGAELSQSTLQTEPRQLLGTPEYMSPEQAIGGGIDVDTRTDVYSLGVLLYELLTGSAPFDSKRLRGASVAEVQQIIAHEEPPCPSTRLSSTSADGSGPGHRALAHRTRQLRGDLDWIVMKAMEKDRARRYESVSALAADVRRHLNHEPVEASPPSITYRLGKLARRHTGLLVAGGAVGCAVLLGLTTTTIGFLQARSEAQRAHKAEQDAIGQRNMALAAQQDALMARDESEEVVGFLVDMLAAADPGMMGRDVTVRQVLDQASAELGDRFASRPLVEARLQDVMGRTYQGLGFYQQAEEHLIAALEARKVAGADEAQVLLATSRLGVIHHLRGRTAEGRRMIEGALASAEASLGPEHDVTLTLRGNLGTMLRAQGMLAEAEQILRESLARVTARFGPDSARTASTKHNLALLLQESQRFEEAMPLTMEVVNARRRMYGSGHPQTIVALQNLAGLLGQTGRAAEGRRMLEGILRVSREKLGADHPRTISIERNLAVSYLNAGEPQKALAPAQHAAAVNARIHGSDSPAALHSTMVLATVLRANGQLEEAQQSLEQTLQQAQTSLGPDHETTLQCLRNLAALYQQRDLADDAFALLEQGLEASASRYGEASPHTIDVLESLASLAESQKQLDRAGPLWLRLFQARRQMLGRHDQDSISAAGKGATWLVAQQREDEAEALLVGVYDECSATLGAEHKVTLLAARSLMAMYRRIGDFEQAQSWQQKATAARAGG